MSTPKSKLHDFHLRLCRYASENLAEHLDDVAFSDHDQQEYAALIEYVRQCGDNGLLHGPDMLGLLLNDDELDRLGRWARSLELSTDGMPLRPPRSWDGIPQYHKLARRCVTEIKKALPGWEKMWSSDSAQFAEELEATDLGLAEGIEKCRRWAKEVVRYQKQLLREDLIPRPTGEFPTPTTGHMTVVVSKIESTLKKLTQVADRGDNSSYVRLMKEAIANCDSDDDVNHLASHYHIQSYVDSMRWAIDNKGDASSKELYDRIVAHNHDEPGEPKKPANRQLCFLASNILASLGEHVLRGKRDWRNDMTSPTTPPKG